MITLSRTHSLQGIAGVDDAITYMIIGNRIGDASSYKILAQGQMGVEIAPLYTASIVDTVIKKIILINSTSSTVGGVILYINGITPKHIFQPPVSILPYGKIVFTESIDLFYDGNGRVLMDGNTEIPT